LGEKFGGAGGEREFLGSFKKKGEGGEHGRIMESAGGGSREDWRKDLVGPLGKGSKGRFEKGWGGEGGKPFFLKVTLRKRKGWGF